MVQTKKIFTLFLLLIPALIFSQKNLQKDEKDAVIEGIKALIHSNYVFIDRVEYVNNALDSLHQTGKYDAVTDYKDFAKVLSDDLVAITKDKHFKVQYSPELLKSRRERAKRQEEQQNTEEAEEEVIDWNEWYARQENFGFTKVEILEGNIGYMKLNFWHPLEWVESTIDATMGFLTNTDALIIDLRENQGGYSPTDTYLGSYFFDAQPKLWMSSYNRPTGETNSDSTFQELAGARYLDKPVYILVGEQTFSLAESFAYGMKHFGRATIIGQTTPGAAHGINFLAANDNFGIQVPVQYNIHPVTKTDWEGTGVQPDITTSTEEALKVAHLQALDRLIDNSTHERIIERYHEIKMKIDKR